MSAYAKYRKREEATLLWSGLTMCSLAIAVRAGKPGLPWALSAALAASHPLPTPPSLWSLPGGVAGPDQQMWGNVNGWGGQREGAGVATLSNTVVKRDSPRFPCSGSTETWRKCWEGAILIDDTIPRQDLPSINASRQKLTQTTYCSMPAVAFLQAQHLPHCSQI